MFLLVRVTGALNENHFVSLRGRHVRIDTFEEADWVAVSEVVVGADNHRAAMRNLFELGKIVGVIQNAAQSIVRGIRRANNPAHKVKRQNLRALTIPH